LIFVINHFSQNNRSENLTRAKFTPTEAIQQNFPEFEGEKGAGTTYTTMQTNKVSQHSAVPPWLPNITNLSNKSIYFTINQI